MYLFKLIFYYFINSLIVDDLSNIFNNKQKFNILVTHIDNNVAVRLQPILIICYSLVNIIFLLILKLSLILSSKSITTSFR